MPSIVRLIALLLPTFLAGPLAAENLVLSRTEATTLALAGNPDLQAARLAIERAAAAGLDTDVLPNPELNFSAATGALTGNDGESAWSIGISQSLPSRARRSLARALASRDVQLAQASVRALELETALEVAWLFDRLEANRDEAALIAKQVDLNAQLHAALEAKRSRAEASSLDLDRTRIAGLALRGRLDSLDREHAAMLADLRGLCGIAPDRSIALSSDRPVPPAALQPPEPAATDRHPARAIVAVEAARAADLSALALAERRGDLTVGVHLETERAMDEPVGRDDSRTIGVAVSFPLPVRDRNRAAIASARVNERQVAARGEALDRSLQRREADLRARYAAVQEQIARHERDLLALADSHVRALEESWAAGLVPLTEIFAAREQRLDLHLAHLHLIAERASLLTEWKAVTASLLP